jgi:hypothetical protein
MGAAIRKPPAGVTAGWLADPLSKLDRSSIKLMGAVAGTSVEDEPISLKSSSRLVAAPALGPLLVAAPLACLLAGASLSLSLLLPLLLPLLLLPPLPFLVGLRTLATESSENSEPLEPEDSDSLSSDEDFLAAFFRETLSRFSVLSAPLSESLSDDDEPEPPLLLLSEPELEEEPLLDEFPSE